MWNLLKSVTDQLSIVKMCLLNTIPFTHINQCPLYASFVCPQEDERGKWMSFWKEMDELDVNFNTVLNQLPHFHGMCENKQIMEDGSEVLFHSVKQNLAIDSHLKQCDELLQILRKWEAFGYQAVPGTPVFRNAFLDILCYRHLLMNAAEQMEFLWKRMYEQEKVSLEKEEGDEAGHKNATNENGNLSGKHNCWEQTKPRRLPSDITCAKYLEDLQDFQSLKNSSADWRLNNSSKLLHDDSFPQDKYLEPLTVESCQLNDLNLENYMNPWLSLPVIDLKKPSTKCVSWNPLNKVNRSLKNVPRHKAKPENYLETDFSTNYRKCNINEVPNYQERGVQTDLSIKTLDTITYTLEMDELFSKSLNGQNDMDNKQSIIWDSYDLHISRNMYENNRQHDWDLKEQEELQGIEKLLENAEAIFREEEMALREEQVLENLLEEEEHPVYCVFTDDLNEGSHSQQEETQKNMQNDETGLNQLSSTPNVKISNGSTIWVSPGKTNISYPTEEAVMKAQNTYLDLVRELKEIYTIEDRIFEENRKIKEFREVESCKSVKEPECSINLTKRRLSFLAQLQSERNQVEELEHSLVKVEEKRHKHITNKMDRARIKGYSKEAYKKISRALPEHEYGKFSEIKFPIPSNTSSPLSLLEYETSPLHHFKAKQEAKDGKLSHKHFRKLRDARIVEGSDMTAGCFTSTVFRNL
ncbi:hypothetical protein GDO86_005838 [Hymenochirus boettgeri]|uniref:Uncharacterized protein n=1 Tax=Hymenochirus boettgeri TaxID=247094 RepID=A0A8T2J664_9PIPI|nr:hypothetical protein GDO86_005838 [Hymenochirus boettgeri]